MSNSSSSSSGVGFAGLLTVAFVVLKLTHYIDWSWWWVFSPIWISLLVALAILIVVGGVYAFIEMRPKRRRF